MPRRLPLTALAVAWAPLATAAVAGFAAVRLTGRDTLRSSEAVAFTPSVALGSVALAALAAASRRWRSAAGLATSAALLGGLVLPRSRPRPQPAVDPGGGTRVRVLSANCLKGRADAGALIALVDALEPDVLMVQEQNPRFVARLIDAGIADRLPHQLLAAGGRSADAGLFSRHPLARIARGLPPEFVAGSAALPGGRSLPLVSAHPWPPVGARHTRVWRRSMASVPPPAGPLAGGIVAGDLNATLDHPELRAVLAGGWRDAAAEVGAGLRATWSEFGLLRLTIDHILVPPGARVEEYRVHRLAGSDHRAISATVLLP